MTSLPLRAPHHAMTMPSFIDFVSPRIRAGIIALVSAACGVAGSIATGLPGGAVPEAAAKVADRCEAAGFRAYPPGYGPQLPDTTAPIVVPSPTPGPVLEQPAPLPAAGPELGHLVPLPARHLEHRLASSPGYAALPVLLWPPARAWRGEGRGWVAAAS